MFAGAGPCVASEVRSSICEIASDLILSLDYIRTHGIFFCRVLFQVCFHKYLVITMRNRISQRWGSWSHRGLNLLPQSRREASRWFFTSAALCAKTWVLPMELGGTSLTSQPHVNPPNLGSQTLRLQRGAAPFTSHGNCPCLAWEFPC